MKRYAMMETGWGKCLFALFLFVMLLLARDTLITSCLIGFEKSQFLMLGLICLFGVVFLLHNRREWKALLTDRRMAMVALSALVMVFPMLCKGDWTLMYFSILFCLVFAVFLTYFTTWQEVAKYYIVILAGLGLYSLAGMYVIKPMMAAGKWIPEVFYNSAGMEFGNFWLTFVVPWEAWHRNFGIFREPGVYQFFLILGIYLNHYGASWKKEWVRWLLSAILAATMISTFAIGGFLELGMLAVFGYFDKKAYRTRAGKLIGMAAAAAVLAAVLYIIFRIRRTYFENTVFYEFYDMFKRLTTDSDSLVDRISAIFISAGMFLKNPVYGNDVYNVLHGTAHNTSSTLILYAILGILGGTLNVAAWIALFWKKERNLFGNLVLMGILFMSFNTQNLVADVFFWLFPYMALTEVILPKLKLPERKV